MQWPRGSWRFPAIGLLARNVMSRKSFALAIVIIFLLVGLFGATGVALVRHEPNFYKRCELPPGKERNTWRTLSTANWAAGFWTAF